MQIWQERAQKTGRNTVSPCKSIGDPTRWKRFCFNPVASGVVGDELDGFFFAHSYFDNRAVLKTYRAAPRGETVDADASLTVD